ncbi:MAG TPA: alpha-2-macroglobulin family protein [Thermoanaerobaculia bacterium]|nr:alpha-2-macroglobulin family protein [Thermoanaerobaculia bacterium]
MRTPRTGFFAVLGFLLFALIGALAAPTPSRPAGPAKAPGKEKPAAKDAWAEVERLIEEQKLEQASNRLEALLAKAQQSGDSAAWARALIRRTEVRIALGGFETAVRELRESPWPSQLLARTGLDLYFGHALTSYAASYSWEINRRERVDTQGKLDLKLWTREQIVAAATEAFLDAWKNRAALGREPVGRLAEVVVSNNYPREVRGTLRDAVAYLFADLLADASLWSPEQTNDLYRLDLSRLLEMGGGAAAAVRLDDAGTHPVEKLAAALADLEAWHTMEGRREAALEANLERARRLHQAFAQQADRRRIREELETRLAQDRDLAWWAEGQAVLAGLLREDDDPQALIAAHRAALAGARAYPRSPGAQDCRRVVAEIEAPEFSAQAMTSDGLGRRSIAVDYKNLPRLFFRAYRVDVLGRLASGTSEPFPESWRTREILRPGPPAASWVADLPATPDFRQHRSYVVPQIAEAGAYLVAISANDSFSEARNHILETPLVLGDLVLLASPDAGGEATRLRVLSASSGAALPGVEIRVFWRSWQRGYEVATLTTDASGAAPFVPPGGGPEPWRSYLALARRGSDLAVLEIGPGPQPQESGPAALFFTDRSIYRPGQIVRWKALAYGGDRRAGRLALEPHRAMTVKLVDPNGQEVATATVATNDFGTAAGEFVVPAGRPLGAWSLTGSLPGQASIQVEEYKRPTFEVTLKAPAEALRLNRAAAFRGEARYYFGLPVTSGRMRWEVRREPVYPPWWWWWEGSANLASTGQGGSQVVASGTGALGEDGAFEARFAPAADERLDKEVTYSYRLSVEVTDEGGETRTADRSFRLGFAAIEAAIESDRQFLDPQAAAEMTVLRRDLDGAPRPGAGTWRLLELREPEKPRLPSEEPIATPPRAGQSAALRTPGDDLAPRWQGAVPPAAALRQFADGAEVAGGDLTHDDQGRAALTLPPLQPGSYRLRYETRDEFGGLAAAQRELVVAGEAPLAVAVLLLAQQTSARVGETISVLIHSGFSGQALELQIQRGPSIERRNIVARAAPQRVVIPVGENDRGGLAFSVVAVRDHQLLRQEAIVAVPWDNREVKVDYQTFRDLLRPGAKETWRVKVTETGARGPEPAAAELLAYMYDRSLDAYAPHRPPRPLDLFPQGVAAVATAASLGGRPAYWFMGNRFAELPEGAALHGDLLRQIDLYGIGGPGWRARLQMPAPPPAPKPVEGGVAGGAPMAEAIMVTAEAPLLAKRNSVGGNLSAELKPAPPPALRSNFSETAFWQPHLLTAADGTAAIEFTVPDSVTSWSVWTHALTKDFRSGFDHREARSVKDLMVRPYLPRFLREGDHAELRVVLDDAAERPLDGDVTLDILDPDSDASVRSEFGLAEAAARQRFHLAPGKSATVTFSLAAPKRVGQVAFKVVATAGDTSDGELRPLPLLPSRVHLAQSRFVALHDREKRTMTFDDLERTDDPTRLNEQLVVTLDAQLFYSVLAAVPYLVDYPYECTEQTLNRFLSTAILTSLFDRYPAVGRMARELAQRETEVEAFGGTDPNRQMALEETPWLLESQGKQSAAADRPLIKVLDPRIAEAQRESALAKLVREQLPSGAFPWWSGGPPSDFMTLYLLYGLAKAGEFGVAVPRGVVTNGWRYLGEKYRREIRDKIDKPDCDCAWEFLTFLNYTASAYPDPSWIGDALPAAERKRILDASFRHWKEHSPYLKGLLSLTLKRMGRPQDARLVFDSVMDSAKTTPDEGTFWQPEDRSWLWYNDTIETHAFALRALLELRPKDAHLDGLVQWLFLNKKLNHWKSTRATAEVVYSLAKYLASQHELAVREAARVEVAGQQSDFVFEPDRYTGKKVQIVVPGAKLGPRDATVAVSKETPGLLFASATWHFSTEALPQEARGGLFAVERRYFRRVRSGKEMVLQPLEEGAALAPGDEIEVQLSLRSKAAAEYVHLRDPRAAGFEPGVVVSGWKWDLGLARYEEVRDSGTNFFIEWLPAGQYTLKYRVRAALGGTFRVGPATVQSMYAPEFTAYSAGNLVRVAGER